MEMTSLNINYFCCHHHSITFVHSRCPFYAIIVIMVSLIIINHYYDIIFEGVQEASLRWLIQAAGSVDLEAPTQALAPSTVSNSSLGWASVPNLILIMIFSPLREGGRASHGVTHIRCWCWVSGREGTHPCSWRHQQFDTDHDFLSTELEPLVEWLILLGQWTRGQAPTQLAPPTVSNALYGGTTKP